MNNSRKKNSIKNIITGFIGKVIVFIFAFIARTVFIKSLGAEYLGINGLYTNILSFLSLVDLGIGNVLNYSLYRLLATNNKKKISGTVAQFKFIYIGIGLIILLLGLALIPVLPFVVKSTLPNRYVVLFYCLFLINSVLSYFFVYKTTIITADQKQYINNTCTCITQCVMYAAQIAYLIIYKDFIGFLIIQIIYTVSRNLILSYIAEKKYPYIKGANRDKSSSFKYTDLWKDVKATFIYKLCFTSLTYTNNIFISMLLGTVIVGYYSNYYLLIQYISAYIFIITSGLHASVGNYLATKSTNESYTLFKTIFFMYSSIDCIIITVFACCIQQFISIWVGEEYVLSTISTIAILLAFYIDIIFAPVTLFRETFGLFVQTQYIMLPAALINIVLSILLGLFFGLSGILFASTISKLLTSCWYEPIIVLKRLNVNGQVYLFRVFKSVLITLFAFFISYCLCKSISTNIIGLIFRASIASIVSFVCILLFNIRSKELKYLIFLLKSYLTKKELVS